MVNNVRKEEELYPDMRNWLSSYLSNKYKKNEIYNIAFKILFITKNTFYTPTYSSSLIVTIISPPSGIIIIIIDRVMPLDLFSKI